MHPAAEVMTEILGKLNVLAGRNRDLRAPLPADGAQRLESNRQCVAELAVLVEVCLPSSRPVRRRRTAKPQRFLNNLRPLRALAELFAARFRLRWWRLPPRCVGRRQPAAGKDVLILMQEYKLPDVLCGRDMRQRRVV